MKTNREEIEKALDNPIEIIKDKYNPVDSESIQETLTPRQEKFCQLYALDTTCFGNGVKSYLEIYDIDQSKKGWYDTACQSASRLLSNAKVYNRINELLSDEGLNDEFVDKQLLQLLSQQDDRGIRLGAIKEYNNLKNRITKKIEMSGSLEIKHFDHIDALLDDNG